MKIAIQGIEGSFHDQAVQRLFPNEEIELVKCESFDGVTQNVKKGKADYGVLAIENSIAGSILPNYNLVEAGDFEILDEVFLNIQMYLMALETESIIDIFEVHSHPVALLQCNDYLRKFPPQFKVIEGKDTASEAKRIIGRLESAGLSAPSSFSVASSSPFSLLCGCFSGDSKLGPCSFTSSGRWSKSPVCRF